MPNPELSQYHDHDSDTVYDLKDATARGDITELYKYQYKVLSVYVMNGGGFSSDRRRFIFDISTVISETYFRSDYDGGVIRCIFTPWPDALTYDPDAEINFDIRPFSQHPLIVPVYTNAKRDTVIKWGEVNNFVMDFVFRKTETSGYFIALSAVASVNAANVAYNNGTSGLTAGNVQDAIDEVNAEKIGDNPTFSEAATRQNIASGETFAVILGKIKKFFSDLKAVAFSGSYNDLTDTPTIPAAQVNSDWNANSGVAEILNKPTLATVATSGDYGDLSGTPTLATVATSGKASDVSYNNTGTSLTDTDVQTAISSLANNKADSSSLARVATTGESYDVSYNNGTSGLSSSNVKDAIDELALDLSGKQGTLTAGNNISISSGNVIDSNARGIDVNGTTTINPNDAINLNLVAGSNMSITANGADVTFAATDTKPSSKAGTADQSTATSGTYTNRAHVQLSEGLWLLVANTSFQSNATGLRHSLISSNSASETGTVAYERTNATNGNQTNHSLSTVVNVESGAPTYYLVMRQNSGTNLSIGGTLTAVRLGPHT